MHWIQLVLLALLFEITGVIYRINQLWTLDKQREFAQTYRNKFIEFTNDPDNRSVINWLHFNSNRIQNETGSLGMVDYRPPAASYIIKNYPVFLNLIGDITRDRRLDHGLGIFNDSIASNVSTLDEVLLRYLGSLEELMNEHKRLLKNPVRMFADGIRSFIRLPVTVLYWSGIISQNNYRRVVSNPVARVIGFILACLGVIGTVITIVTGWHSFIVDIHGLKQL